MAGTAITWERFKTDFLEKYFLADVRCKKEIEFLELKQGGMSVAQYASKFEELMKYCSHYNSEAAEESKCIKFESGLRPEIKQGIRYQEIHRFPTLVNKCRIFDEDSCHTPFFAQHIYIFVASSMSRLGKAKVSCSSSSGCIYFALLVPSPSFSLHVLFYHTLFLYINTNYQENTKKKSVLLCLNFSHDTRFCFSCFVHFTQ